MEYASEKSRGMFAIRIRGAGSRLVILLYVPEPNEGHVHVSTLSDSLPVFYCSTALTSFAGERF